LDASLWSDARTVVGMASSIGNAMRTPPLRKNLRRLSEGFIVKSLSLASGWLKLNVCTANRLSITPHSTNRPQAESNAFELLPEVPGHLASTGIGGFLVASGKCFLSPCVQWCVLFTFAFWVCC